MYVVICLYEVDREQCTNSSLELSLCMESSLIIDPILTSTPIIPVLYDHERYFVASLIRLLNNQNNIINDYLLLLKSLP